MKMKSLRYLGLLLLGLNLGWPRAAKATDIVWEPWSAERVEQLRGAPLSKPETLSKKPETLSELYFHLFEESSLHVC